MSIKVNISPTISAPITVYKKIRVLKWRFIEIFPNFSLKKPNKVDFWAKKVAVYLNFVLPSVGLLARMQLIKQE